MILLYMLQILQFFLDNNNNNNIIYYLYCAFSIKYSKALHNSN